MRRFHSSILKFLVEFGKRVVLEINRPDFRKGEGSENIFFWEFVINIAIVFDELIDLDIFEHIRGFGVCVVFDCFGFVVGT